MAPKKQAPADYIPRYTLKTEMCAPGDFLSQFVRDVARTPLALPKAQADLRPLDVVRVHLNQLGEEVTYYGVVVMVNIFRFRIVYDHLGKWTNKEFINGDPEIALVQVLHREGVGPVLPAAED